MADNIKNNLAKRLIVAFPGAIFFLTMIILNKWTCYILFFGLSMLVLREFYSITALRKVCSLYFTSMLFASFLNIAFFIHFSGLQNLSSYVIYLVLILPCILAVGLFQKSLKNSFKNIAFSLLGLIYIMLPFSILYMIAFDEKSYKYGSLLAVLFMIWANDSGAFFIGKLFGKIKLYEKISPKKSWEGVMGGGMLCCITGYAMSFFDIFEVGHWFIFSLAICVLSVVGDLVASQLKRSLEIKDTSNFLPGHGGLLDRFDSFIFVVPFFVSLKYFLEK